MKKLSDIDVSGKRVFLRGDLDVNVEQLTIRELIFDKSKSDNLQLTGAIRLQNLKPTVDYLISHNAKQIIIAGHIGRPEGRDEKLSTKKLVPILEKILGQKIVFQDDVFARSTSNSLSVNSATKQSDIEIATPRPFNEKGGARNDSKEARVILLENLRFWEGEEKNDPEFAKQLASMADIYINEAFGVCHRSHASIVGVPVLLPHSAGLRLEEEVNQLTKLIKNPQRPMAAIIGGAKLETKIPVIESLSKVADWVLVGGLLASQGEALQGYGGRVVIASLRADSKDIDDEAIAQFREILKGAKTVVWNGPVGYFEGGFDKGTLAIAQAVIDSGAYSVIGGGETTEFLGSKGLLDKFGFVSSGGGAMLEFLAGKKLPGIMVL